MHASPRAVWLVSLLTLAAASKLAAQASIQFLLVEETHYFTQTGDTATVESSGTSSPWSIDVALSGSNLAAFTGSLTFASPAGSGVTGGTATYSSADDAYRFYQSYATWTALNAAFAGGTFDVVYNGTHVPLTLSGNLFPAAPTISVTGSTTAWNGGVLTVAAGHDLTLSANFADAASYGSGNAHFSLGAGGNGYSDSVDLFGTSGQLVIPAADLVAGQTYNVWVNFAGIMSMSNALSPITSAAVYSSETDLTIMVAVPEPATVAWVAGALALGLAGYRRWRLA